MANIVETLDKVGKFFFEKIQATEKFTNDRIAEWNEKMPVPPLMKFDGEEKAEIADKQEFNEIHKRLVKLDNRNSCYGEVWVGDKPDEFYSALESLKQVFGRGNINDVNRNLVEYHSGIYFRGIGNYVVAYEHFRLANEIIDKSIGSESVNPLFWPRLYRDTMLNRGHQSTTKLLYGERKESFDLAESIFDMLEKTKFKDDIKLYEGERKFCPILSWAYYYSCRASLHLHCSDEVHINRKTEATFRTAFADGHHRNWPVPTLFQILNDKEWRKHYPIYFDEIASIVYKGAPKSVFTRMARKLSVAMGRSRIKIAPALGAAGVAVLAITWYVLDGQENTASSKNVIDNFFIFIDQMKQEFLSAMGGPYETERESIEGAFREVKEKARELLSLAASADANIESIINSAVSMSDVETILLANGNEHTVV